MMHGAYRHVIGSYKKKKLGMGSLFKNGGVCECEVKRSVLGNTHVDSHSHYLSSRV